MIQAAHFDIKTVTGLRQALVLSAEYENEPFPLEGYTLHGSIGTYPRMDLKCSVDENGRARIEWDSVPPGNWKYDVFLISASNDETPLMEGTFTALPRITPVLDDESVNDEVGGVLHLPSGNEGTITLEVDGGFVSKEYAAIAKDAAEKAQQALEDIKQALQGVVTSIGGASGDILLDSGLKITSGVTMNQSLTVGGPVNANGGINIPLAVGAPTDTAAVNRFYALGMAGAVSALIQPIYLNSSSITVSGSISKSSNGTLAGLTQRFSVGAASAGSNAYGSAVIPLIGPNGQFNYSSVCGFSLAVNATAFAKFTFGIGRGSKTNRTGLTMDSYSMIPGNELAVNHGEIIDVTINTPYDTVRKGYEIRVREIFYVSSVGHWQVKTTTVFLPVGHNELMPNGLNRLIYMQSGLPSTAVREEKAALYMELGGGSTNTLFKIASLRGFIAFEAGTGVSTLIIDARNEKTYALSADAGTGTRHLYSNGLTNPTYHALEAMAVNAIETEETAAFEDINVPIEES